MTSLYSADFMGDGRYVAIAVLALGRAYSFTVESWVVMTHARQLIELEIDKSD